MSKTSAKENELVSHEEEAFICNVYVSLLVRACVCVILWFDAKQFVCIVLLTGMYHAVDTEHNYSTSVILTPGQPVPDSSS